MAGVLLLLAAVGLAATLLSWAWSGGGVGKNPPPRSLHCRCGIALHPDAESCDVCMEPAPGWKRL